MRLPCLLSRVGLNLFTLFRDVIANAIILAASIFLLSVRRVYVCHSDVPTQHGAPLCAGGAAILLVLESLTLWLARDSGPDQTHGDVAGKRYTSFTSTVSWGVPKLCSENKFKADFSERAGFASSSSNFFWRDLDDVFFFHPVNAVFTPSLRSFVTVQGVLLPVSLAT